MARKKPPKARMAQKLKKHHGDKDHGKSLVIEFCAGVLDADFPRCH